MDVDRRCKRKIYLNLLSKAAVLSHSQSHKHDHVDCWAQLLTFQYIRHLQLVRWNRTGPLGP